MLYAGEEAPRDQVTVPNLSGMSFIAAQRELEYLGMFIRTTGAPRFDSRTEVSVQSIAAGEQTVFGAIIEVTLINTDAVARN